MTVTNPHTPTCAERKATERRLKRAAGKVPFWDVWINKEYEKPFANAVEDPETYIIRNAVEKALITLYRELWNRTIRGEIRYEQYKTMCGQLADVFKDLKEDEQ